MLAAFWHSSIEANAPNAKGGFTEWVEVVPPDIVPVKAIKSSAYFMTFSRGWLGRPKPITSIRNLAAIDAWWRPLWRLAPQSDLRDSVTAPSSHDNTALLSGCPRRSEGKHG